MLATSVGVVDTEGAIEYDSVSALAEAGAHLMLNLSTELLVCWAWREVFAG